MKLFYKISFSKKNILHHFFDFFFKKGVFPVRKGFFTVKKPGTTPNFERQIEENRLNLNRSTQRGVSTAYNTCFN